MENNNLDDFFNKKLNDFDSSGDDWDKLGKTPFDNIQPSFPKYTKATWITPISILTGVMGVALTALVVYTFYLKNEIHTLQQHILTENIIKETTHSNTTSADNSLNTINENQSTKTQQVKSEQISKNETIGNDKSNIITNQNNPILNNHSQKTKEEKREKEIERKSILNKEKSSKRKKEKEIQHIITKSKEEKTSPNLAISLSEKNDNQKASATQKINQQKLSQEVVFDVEKLNFLASISPKELAVKPSLLANLDIQYKKAPRKKSAFRSKIGSFSLGYEYSFANMIIPYDLELKDANSLPTRDDFNSVRSHHHGLMLGYTWNTHWGISTGIRRSKTRLKQEINSNSIYSSANEYTLLNGLTANDLTIDKFSPLTNQVINFTLEFPANQNLNNGEVLSINILEQQEIEQIQIPLAVEYLFGKKKVQWFTQLGIQFNFMEVKTLGRNILAQTYNQEVLNISNLSEENNRSEEKSIGIFGSIGANYQLSQHWSLRTSLVYEHDFDNNPKQARGSRDFLTQQALRLGLNYQF
jgi:hypothetical protein